MDALMTKSESIAKLAGALAKAQAQISNARKDSLNPHFQTRYADLAAVWDVCRQPLATNEIAVIQGTEHNGDNYLYVFTMLAHSSGEWMRFSVRLKPVKEDPQGVVSATTYGRRVGLASAVGVAASGDDDDGNGSSNSSMRTERDAERDRRNNQKLADDPEKSKAAADRFLSAMQKMKAKMGSPAFDAMVVSLGHKKVDDIVKSEDRNAIHAKCLEYLKDIKPATAGEGAGK
jgi:hypothetical protein